MDADWSAAASTEHRRINILAVAAGVFHSREQVSPLSQRSFYHRARGCVCCLEAKCGRKVKQVNRFAHGWDVK